MLRLLERTVSSLGRRLLLLAHTASFPEFLRNISFEGTPLISLLLVTAFISILPAASEAADVTLAWDSNVEQDIAGYHVAYGQASGNYTAIVDVGNTTSYRVFNLDSNRTYFFAVRAYNFKGVISGFSSEVSTTTVGAPLALTSVSIDQSSPKPVGTRVVFTANAVGGIPPYQYKWFVGNTQSSTVMRDWSTDATFAWTPTIAGSYQITAWVRNANTNADAPANGSSSLIVPFTIDAPAVVSPTVVTPLTMFAPTASLPSPQRLGTTIQFTARAYGGVSPVQFRWLVSNGQGWQIQQNWSTSSTFTYTPTIPGPLWVQSQARSATNTTDEMEAQHVILMTILP